MSALPDPPDPTDAEAEGADEEAVAEADSEAEAQAGALDDAFQSADELADQAADDEADHAADEEADQAAEEDSDQLAEALAKYQALLELLARSSPPREDAEAEADSVGAEMDAEPEIVAEAET